MARRPTTWLCVAAAASAGAGLVHAAAAGSHNDDAAVAWLFAVTALLQLGWAAVVVLRPGRALVLGGLLVNAACVTAWVLSRTVGLVGPLAGVEAVGTADTVAAVLATIACVAALAVLLTRPTSSAPLDVPVVVVSAVAMVALVVPAMAAPHTHAHDDGHEHTEVATAAEPAHSDTHTHSDAHAHDGAVAVDDAAPIVSLGDARLTEAQRGRAISLLVATRAALLAQFPDRPSVEAAGYTWIGDGRRAGGFEHFVKQEYLTDGRELDPDHIESIVLQRQADGSERVVTAMYILERGKTMADAPDLAGSLTPWHDHQNLCWDGRR